MNESSAPAASTAPKITVPLNQSKDSDKKLHQPLKKQIIFVFIIASLGVFAAFGTFFIMNQFSSQDLSQVDETLAWRPTLSGSCQNGNIRLGPEPAEFDVVLTATKNGQSQTLNFASGPDKQLDEAFQWPFTVANGDVVSWNVRVTWNGGEETHQGQLTISGCTTQPSPTTVAYSEPSFPACPAGSQQFTINGEVANSSSNRSKSHTLTVASAGQITSMSGFKKEGHPEESCQAGTGNDNGTYPCDQEQLNEGFTVKVNGSVYGTVNDEGAGKDDEWFDFAITRTVPLTSGNNTVIVEHVGGNGIGSVDYKATICYNLGAQATATQTARATAIATQTSRPTATQTTIPSGSAPVGGVDSTPTPLPTRTATPTPTTQATVPPAPGGDGQSDGQGCAQNDCSGNQVNTVEQNKAVADAGTTANAGTKSQTLPDAGIPGGIFIVLLGVMFTAAGVILGKKSLLKQ